MCVCVSVRVSPFISVLNELVGCLVSYVCVIFLGMVGSENLVMVADQLTVPTTVLYGITTRTKNGCSQEDWTVQAIAGIYVLFSNLLLVNLVIVMFSYKFERVRENSEKLWHFQRYTVICDYNRRIPSPFKLIPRLVQLIFLLKRDRSCDIKIGHTEIDLMNTKEKRKKSALQKNFQKIISFRSYNTK